MELPADFWQLLNQRNTAEKLALFNRRCAQIALPRLGIGHDAGFRPDHGSVGDVDMISQAHLARHHHVLARRAASSYSRLGANQVVASDAAVVSDLHEVID